MNVVSYGNRKQILSGQENYIKLKKKKKKVDVYASVGGALSTMGVISTQFFFSVYSKQMAVAGRPDK